MSTAGTEARRIRRVRIENLGPYEKASFDLEPFTAVVGPNESGKTTLINALLWALTGDTPQFKNRSDIALLVHGDAKKAKVTVEGDGLTIERTSTQSGARTVLVSAVDAESGETVVAKSEKEAAAAIARWLGTEKASPEMVSAALGTSPIVTSDPSFVAKAIDRLVSGPIDRRELRKMIVDEIEDELDDDVWQYLGSHSDLAQARSGAEERRRECKRMAQREESEPSATWRDSEGRVHDLREYDAERIANHLGTEGSRVEKLSSRLEESKRVESARLSMSKVPDLEAQLAEARKVADRGEPDGVADAVESLKALRAEHEDLSRKESERAGALEAQIGPEIDIVAGEPCPTCNRPYTQEDESQAEEKAHERADRIEAHRKHVRASKAASDGRREEIASLEQQLETWRAEIQETRGAAQRVTAIEAQIAAIREHAREGEEITSSEELAGLLEEARASLESARAMASARSQYDSEMGAWRARQEDASGALRRADLWDKLAKALDPKRVPARIAAQRVEPLQMVLNVLSRWLPHEVTFDEMLHLHADGDDPRILSRGAALICNVALQIAILNQARIPILLVDDANLLDPKRRDALAGMVNDAIKRGCIAQAIVCATSSEREPKAPASNSGIAVYKVGAGSAGRLVA